MKRRILTIALSSVIAISCLGLALALHLRVQYETRGWETAAESDSILPYRMPLPGINVELGQYGHDMHSHLDVIEQLGFYWLRQEFLWSDIEITSGQFDWETSDAIVAAVAEHPNLELVAVLYSTPSSAVMDSNGPSIINPPDSVHDFATFTGAFAERYGNVIDYYQVWDEPNLGSSWGGSPNPAEYAHMLEAVSTTIKSIDSSSTILAAGLAPTIETGPQNISDLLFLSELYEFGASAFFDGIGAKPYGFDTGPNDRDTNPAILNFSRVILLREEMIRRNDEEKPVWVSAFGWNALPDDWSGPASIWGDTTRETQIANILAGYNRAAEEWPWCASLILDSWQPAAPADDPVWGFALLPQDVLPSQLDISPENLLLPVSQTALPGRYPAVSPEFTEYAGEWEFGEFSADIGYAQDSELTFRFHGTDLALELQRDNYRGYLYVTIDGEPANDLPVDKDGNSYIILNSADNKPHLDVIQVASGLTNSSHTLHIRAEYGWDQWALAGFRVGIEPGNTHQALATSAALIGAIALLTVIWNVPWGRMAGFLAQIHNRITFPVHLVLGVTASALLMIGMAFTWSETAPNLLRREPPGLLLGILTSGLLYLSEPFALTLVAVLALWILIYIRLELGLILTILWVPFFLYPLTLYEYAIPVAEICILLTASAWLLRTAIKWAQSKDETSKSFVRPQAIDYGILALLAIATLSLTWAEFRDVAFREWRTTILEPVMFYFIARTTLDEEQKIIHLADALIAAATIAASISMVMYFAGEGVIIAEGATRRLAGVYGSPNNVGLLMGRALPFAIASIVAKSNRQRRVMGLISAIVVFMAAVLSKSAGALLIGIPLSLFVMLFLWKRRLAIMAAVLGAVSGAIALIPLAQNPRFARIFDFSSGSTFFRIRIWESALRMIKAHPLRGYGLDQFLYQYRGRFIFPDAWQEPNLSHPHNILLDLWTRLGLGGVLTMIWLQFHFWKTSLSLYRDSTHSQQLVWLLNIAAIASMVDIIAHGLVDNSIFVIDLSFVFMLILLVPQQLSQIVFDAKAE